MPERSPWDRLYEAACFYQKLHPTWSPDKCVVSAEKLLRSVDARAPAPSGTVYALPPGWVDIMAEAIRMARHYKHRITQRGLMEIRDAFAKPLEVRDA